MKQEVIKDFLNLPGIAGVALMDGRSRPYFCGVDQTLNFQQKEALAQGILQVIETIPEGFESFKFQFAGHQVHIYKLDHGIILLVLTRDNLVYSDYLLTIKNLKAALREDIVNAIATFRLIAGNVTLSGLSYHNSNSVTTQARRTEARANSQPQRIFPTTPSTTNQGSPPHPPAPSKPVPSQTSRPSVPPAHSNGLQQPAATAKPTTSLSDTLAALNQLSKFTTQYLGTHVIANYWKSTRPEANCLPHLQVDRAAQFSFVEAPSESLQRDLNPEEHHFVQEWVAAFIKRCSQVIRDFPVIIQQKALTPEQKSLLLG